MKTYFVALPVLGAGLLAALLTVGVSSAFAQFAVSKFAIAGGGATRSTGGSFGMGGTVGQADAGRSSGGNYVLSSGFWFGGSAVSGVVDDPVDDDVETPASVPVAFQLYPASPHPVDDGMVLTFDLPEPRLVQVEVYDAAGRVVRVLARETISAGRIQRAWDRRDEAGVRVPAGIYFIRISAEADQRRQKIVVLP